MQRDLDEEELSEIQALHTLFEELDFDVVYSVYMGCNRDRHQATRELGELVQQPQKLERYMATLGQRMRPPGGPCPSMGEEEDQLPTSHGSSASRRDLLPAMQDPPASSFRRKQEEYEEPEEPQEEQPQQPWQHAFTIGETLSDVGTSLAEGVTMMAHNITGWVADLVSAGWGDEEEEEAYAGGSRHAQEQPTRGFGGSLDQGMEHLHQRRGGGGHGESTTMVAEEPSFEPPSFFDQPFFSEGDSEEEEGEDDIKKDA